MVPYFFEVYFCDKKDAGCTLGTLEGVGELDLVVMVRLCGRRGHQVLHTEVISTQNSTPKK